MDYSALTDGRTANGIFLASSDQFATESANASVGLTGPETSQMRDDIIGYIDTVVRVEWPAQAEGLIVDRGKTYLEKLNRLAIGLKPSSVAEGNLHPQLLQFLAVRSGIDPNSDVEDHRSMTMSPVGREQQINTLPSAGGSTGSGR